MAEFWEKSFQDKQEMWGWEPADSVAETVELFKKHGLIKILIPDSVTVEMLRPYMTMDLRLQGLKFLKPQLA